MDRNEFVSALRAALIGKVPEAVVNDNVRYYDSYISQEIAGGRSEREVLDSLGDPRLIAKTIVDTQEEPEREIYREYEQEDDRAPQYRHVNMNTWYGKLLTFVIIILILTAVFSFVGWILPILFPLLLLIWVFRTFFRNR